MTGVKHVTIPGFKRSLAMVLVACTQNILGGGLIIGWAGISGSLLASSTENGGGNLTLDQTTFIFSVSSCVSFISPLFLGIILDRYGPRLCSIVSNVLVALGCAVFASARSQTVFSFGASLIAFGGPGFQISMIHLSILFPRCQYLVMSSMTGTITLSFAVFPLLDIIWQTYDVSLEELFHCYSIVIFLSVAVSFLIFPDDPYEKILLDSPAPIFQREWTSTDPVDCQSTVPVSDMNLVKQPLNMRWKTTSSIIARKVIASENWVDVSNASVREQTLGAQLIQGSYLRLTAIYVVTSFWANFHVGSITIELGDERFFSDEQINRLCLYFSFITAMGFFLSPLVGMLLDCTGFFCTAIITIGLGAAQMLLLLPTHTSIAVRSMSFVFYSLFRSFLYPYFYACLSRKMGFKYFGALSGISSIVSGFMQLSISPLTAWTEGNCHEDFSAGGEHECDSGKWHLLHSIQLCTLILLTTVPFFDKYFEIKRSHEVKHVLWSSESESSTEEDEAFYGSIEEMSFDT